jgi:thiosulfate reductase/polysulfide reductase chain A
LRARGKIDLPPRERDEITFNTPSGKIEVYSETLANAGYSAWPAWEEPPAPDSDEFYLLTGKVGQHTQTATQNNLFLHEVEDAPRLWLHPRAAEPRGIADGDRVRVTSPVGQVVLEAHVTEGIRPDCVFMAAGYGHLSKGLRTAYGRGASDSDLHVTYTDPVSGGQALTQTFVRIEKA